MFYNTDVSFALRLVNKKDYSTDPNPLVQTELLVIVFVSIERIQDNVVVHKLSTNLSKMGFHASEPFRTRQITERTDPLLE